MLALAAVAGFALAGCSSINLGPMPQTALPTEQQKPAQRQPVTASDREHQRALGVAQPLRKSEERGERDLEGLAVLLREPPDTGRERNKPAVAERVHVEPGDLPLETRHLDTQLMLHTHTDKILAAAAFHEVGTIDAIGLARAHFGEEALHIAPERRIETAVPLEIRFDFFRCQSRAFCHHHDARTRQAGKDVDWQFCHRDRTKHQYDQ